MLSYGFTSDYRPSVSRGTGTSWLNPPYWVLKARVLTLQCVIQQEIMLNFTVDVSF